MTGASLPLPWVLGLPTLCPLLHHPRCQARMAEARRGNNSNTGTGWCCSGRLSLVTLEQFALDFLTCVCCQPP